MQITEEQRKRAEDNRLAAIAKRKALVECGTSEQTTIPWRFSKCTKTSDGLPSRHQKFPQNESVDVPSVIKLPEKFRVKLEICSPDSFSVTPEAVKGFVYRGEEECLRRIGDCLADVIPSHYTQNHGGGKACVYKIGDYNAVLKCLKDYKVLEVDVVPFSTLNVIERLSHSFVTGKWDPCRPEHLPDGTVNELIEKLPRKLLTILLPFQLDGLRFGLRRGGRCLIADEMGLGKTLQAIAIAGCFMDEGPILVVCPAILRYSWAEELERWLPICSPSEIHLVFGHRNDLVYLMKRPRVVVISYTMLQRLQKSILDREWALLIVDESHHIRCSKKKSEPPKVKAVLNAAAKIKRILLLSGTPSLSRPYDIFHQINILWPGLLGNCKYDFAKAYCDVKTVHCSQEKTFQDFSKGNRLEELNVLLKQTVMIRRLKEHVLLQLPPKRRQIIRLVLKRSEIILAKNTVRVLNGDSREENVSKQSQASQNLDRKVDGIDQLSSHEVGIAKLSGFRKWLSIHPLVTEFDTQSNTDINCGSQKMIIFGHHRKVLDGIQEFICEKGIGFVRIDGSTLANDRKSAVFLFRSSNEIKIAIIGITAGGVGLDFSSAQNVVFLELPQSPSMMLQAEDRAHRRGQRNAVNIYIFCAKDTVDERHWTYLNKSLHRVSSTTDGKYDAIKELSVDGVSYLQTPSSAPPCSADTNCAEQISDHSRCNRSLALELFKLPDHSMSQDVMYFEAYDGLDSCSYNVAEKMSNSACGGTLIEDLHIKKHAEIVPDESKSEFLSEGATEGIFSKAEIVVHGDLTGTENQIEKEQPLFLQANGVNTVEPLQPNQADEYPSEQVDSLRFEVSQYTGRIHLYVCTPGMDSRPRPLFESFRPEDLESQNVAAAAANKMEEPSPILIDNPSYLRGLLTFVDEWKKLRPVDRQKLLAKPLQLPLTVELCYLKESSNHDKAGVLKARSKRRTTPLDEISDPLPLKAIWKKVCLRVSSCKSAEYIQGWTLMDEPLCKFCQNPCKGDRAKTPEFFEDLFCKLSCFEDYRLQTSSKYIRQQLFLMEHGVCSNCHLNCHKLVETIKPLSLARRCDEIEKMAPKLASHISLRDKLVNEPREGNAWHADHIVPVYQGGGECRLENMRTLCVVCHADVTAAQAADRKLKRADAKKKLKDALKNLKNGGSFEGAGDNKVDDNVDDELLVTVPGSSYSRGFDK